VLGAGTIAYAVNWMDHRVALVLLAALNMVAAGSAGLAWARMLPEELPPFASLPSSPPGHKASDVGNRLSSFFLLVLVTVAYVVRFPGFPLNVSLRWLHSSFSDSDVAWIVFAVYAFLVVGLGLTACYAAIQSTRTRVPLALAATFTLFLWLLTPMLRAALLGD
jgi:hypothetical protein